MSPLPLAVIDGTRLVDVPSGDPWQVYILMICHGFFVFCESEVVARPYLFTFHHGKVIASNVATGPSLKLDD